MRALAGAVLALLAGSASASAQEKGADDVALSRIRSGVTLAMTAGTRDSAVALLLSAAAIAERASERAIQVTALRGAASLLSMRRPCTDSAERVLRSALAASEPGDRSATDALVRLLAARGRSDDARRLLVNAYADVPGLGRSITRESLRYLQGQAAIERGGGHEAAALSALSQAMTIATRLSQGDAGDGAARASANPDANSAWLTFDLAMLRLTARTASIRSPRDAYRLFALLDALPEETLEGGGEDPHPTMRLDDRIALVTLAPCARDGANCPPPAPRGC